MALVDPLLLLVVLVVHALVAGRLDERPLEESPKASKRRPLSVAPEQTRPTEGLEVVVLRTPLRLVAPLVQVVGPAVVDSPWVARLAHPVWLVLPVAGLDEVREPRQVLLVVLVALLGLVLRPDRRLTLPVDDPSVQPL